MYYTIIIKHNQAKPYKKRKKKKAIKKATLNQIPFNAAIPPTVPSHLKHAPPSPAPNTLPPRLLRGLLALLERH